MSNSLDRSKLLNVPHLGSVHSTKRQLSEVLSLLTRNFVRAGGVVTVCPVAVAPGASFSRNQHPRSPLRGIEPHPLYAR